MRRTIPVMALEFDEGGRTLWVQGLGGTVLRIKTTGRITTEKCSNSPVSHADLMVADNIHFCLGPDQGKDTWTELNKALKSERRRRGSKASSARAGTSRTRSTKPTGRIPFE